MTGDEIPDPNDVPPEEHSEDHPVLFAEEEAAGAANPSAPLRKRRRSSFPKPANVSLAVDYVPPVRPTKLLTKLDTHQCQRARSGEPGLVLQLLMYWNLPMDVLDKANEEYKALFRNAGFGQFMLIDASQISHDYTIALLEPWFPRINTLYFPFFELGPSPADWCLRSRMRVFKMTTSGSCGRGGHEDTPAPSRAFILGRYIWEREIGIGFTETSKFPKIPPSRCLETVARSSLNFLRTEMK